MFAQRYWLWIWYAILTIGVIGFLPAVQWARQTHWKNLDEVLRAFGTICASVGMILLLQDYFVWLGYLMLVLALGVFVIAFVWGRRMEMERKKTPTPTQPG